MKGASFPCHPRAGKGEGWAALGPAGRSAGSGRRRGREDRRVGPGGGRSRPCATAVDPPVWLRHEGGPRASAVIGRRAAWRAGLPRLEGSLDDGNGTRRRGVPSRASRCTCVELPASADGAGGGGDDGGRGWRPRGAVQSTMAAIFPQNSACSGAAGGADERRIPSPHCAPPLPTSLPSSVVFIRSKSIGRSIQKVVRGTMERMNVICSFVFKALPASSCCTCRRPAASAVSSVSAAAAVSAVCGGGCCWWVSLGARKWKARRPICPFCCWEDA